MTRHACFCAGVHQVYINRVEVIEVNDLRTLGGIIHSLNGSLSPTLNRCDQLTADNQLVNHSVYSYTVVILAVIVLCRL